MVTSIRHDAFGDRIFWLIRPRGEEKLVAVIQSFLDESGIHEGARICVVAGFVGSVRQWQRFDGMWDLLGMDGKDPGFHAKRFFARDQDGMRVSPYKDWTDARAAILLAAITESIRTIDVHPIGGIIDVAAFRSYSLDERRHLTGAHLVGNKLKMSGSPNRPYYLVFQAAIIQALRRLKRTDWQVHFVIDQQNTLAPFALRFYNYFKTDLGNDWRSRMGDAQFSSRLDAPPLQAADLLAYSWYQLVLYGRDAIDRDIKSVLDSWSEKEYEFQWFSKDSMDKLLHRTPRSVGQLINV